MLVQRANHLVPEPQACPSRCELFQQVALETFCVASAHGSQQSLRNARWVAQVHDSAAFGASRLSAPKVERASRTPAGVSRPPPKPGDQGREALLEWGFATDQIDRLLERA